MSDSNTTFYALWSVKPLYGVATFKSHLTFFRLASNSESHDEVSLNQTLAAKLRPVEFMVQFLHIDVRKFGGSTFLPKRNSSGIIRPWLTIVNTTEKGGKSICT